MERLRNQNIEKICKEFATECKSITSYFPNIYMYWVSPFLRGMRSNISINRRNICDSLPASMDGKALPMGSTLKGKNLLPQRVNS